MRLSVRAKLLAIVGTTTLAFVVLLVAGTLTARRTHGRLTDIQERLLPKLELGPRLESKFEALRRALQDAVAATDGDALTATASVQGALLEDIASATPILSPGQVAALRSAVDDYYVTAIDVSLSKNISLM